ncbi:MAG TPA: cupin domain-containing protein [Gemmatimonadales bacterium]|nr:cupin domain-containing protein [Gemmatimonadales bacterium]
MNEADAPARVAGVVPPGEGEVIRAFGNAIQFKLTGARTGGDLVLGLATAPPGSGAPPHVHHADDEVFIIVEGRYRVTIDGVTSEAGPGSVVYLPRGSAHSFQVLGPETGRHWVLLTPSGFERFYASAAEVFAAPGPPDRARLEAINAEHGVAFVGGPPAG